MLDVEDWIDVHESDLHDLAQRVGLHDGTMHFVAALVLGGHTDDVVYEQLQDLAGRGARHTRGNTSACVSFPQGRHQIASCKVPGCLPLIGPIINQFGRVTCLPSN